MINDLMQLLGGLGLFLLGMLVMTDGLRSLAGDYVNRALARFTNSPLSGAATGAVSTAILQSSSATTVAAVGFVGAGLLTFPQALGVIFGANFGTTVTGWMVALLGLELKIGDLVLPLILFGVVLRLLGPRRVRQVGMAVAGFGVIFLGIAHLQQGMASYQGLVTPADFPVDTAAGRLQLLAIGVAITLVTQSSSAGVAAALTAVYSGAISFPQAAAMVIGMDVGTTVTAALATLGGSAETRRTGYSHVIYNLLTAVMALLLLTPYTLVWETLAEGALAAHAEIALVAFHSLFNLIGVVLVLPFAAQFARMMTRLVPDPADPVVDRLDRNLLQNPNVALDSVVRILDGEIRRMLDLVTALLARNRPEGDELADLARHLDALHAFVDQIHLQPEQTLDWQRLNAAIHLLDHLQRLYERCEKEPERALNLAGTAALSLQAEHVSATIAKARADMDAGDFADAEHVMQAAAEQLRAKAGDLRAQIMAEVAAGRLDVPDGTRLLESVRWLRRVTYHVWRVCAHVGPLHQTDGNSI